MVLNRKEFIAYFNDMFATDRCDSDEHPIWIAEKYTEFNERGRINCQWFVRVPTVWRYDGDNYDDFRKEYWDWCDKTLTGRVTCFSSSEQDEWWGFENYEDISIWYLRWANNERNS